MNEENVSTESATEDTTTHNVDSSCNSVAATNTTPDTRPDWLPEKFATAEDMAKSYGELESWKGKKEEDIRSAMQEEITGQDLLMVLFYFQFIKWICTRIVDCKWPTQQKIVLRSSIEMQNLFSLFHQS